MEVEQCVNCDRWFEKARNDEEMFCSEDCAWAWHDFWTLLYRAGLLK